MLVEALIAQAAIEGLDVGVLVGLARLDQAQLHAALVRPGHHRPASKLLAVVGTDDAGQAAAECQAIEHPGEHVASHLGIFAPTSGGKALDDDGHSRVRLSEHFIALLEAATNKAPVIDAAVDQAVPRSLNNSRAQFIEIRAKAFAELLSSASTDVQARVREKLEWLHGRASTERDAEAAWERRQERRFE